MSSQIDMGRCPKAKLRVCASCEWIFKYGDNVEEPVCCPKCGFGSYSARYVYGDICYKYRHTQKPWRDKKLGNYTVRLDIEIDEWNKGVRPIGPIGNKTKLYLVGSG